MRIGVIGAGRMGRILASQFAKLGHRVSIANSRGPESLTSLADEIGATAVSVVDAAKAAEVVVLAIPTKAVVEVPKALFANVADSVVVIDIGNYHPELRDGRIDAIDRGMLDSQWVAQQIGRPVIKAFNNIFAHSLLGKGVPKGTTGRIALSVACDSCQLCSDELTPGRKSFHFVIILRPIATNQLKAQDIESARGTTVFGSDQRESL